MTNSTAEAASQVARAVDRSKASIGTAFGARLNGLDLIATEIEDLEWVVAELGEFSQGTPWIALQVQPADKKI